MREIARAELLSLVNGLLAEVAGGDHANRAHSLQAVGVDLWVASAFVSQVQLMDSQLRAHDKPKLEGLARIVLHDFHCAESLRSTGRLNVSLHDHARFASRELPNARFFYAHDRSVPAGALAALQDVRVRGWAISSHSPSTPFSPLLLRSILDRLESSLVLRLSAPSPETFAVGIRGGSLRGALAVLATLYQLDAAALWQFDNTRRSFRSVATFGMGSTDLRLPVGRSDDSVRRGIVSQVLPDRKAVLYDSCDPSVWRPPTHGGWEPFDQSLFRSRKWRSCLAIPIVQAGRLVGALSVYSSKPAEFLLRVEPRLSEHAILCAAAILAQREWSTLAALAARYDEELLTANVSLGALSLSHDVLHYYRSVMHYIEQSEGYLKTGQYPEASVALERARSTMKRTEPVISAMRKLATEARTPSSSKEARITNDIREVFAELEPLLRSILPHYAKGKRLEPERIVVSVRGSVRPVGISPAALERIVVNLCVNASQWRALSVSVVADFERSEREMQLVVRDDGRGISRAARDRVFDRFYSGRNGSGLGLYVVRTIARRAGGDAFLQSIDHTESIEHRGTAVTVVLPTERAEGPHA